MKLLALLLLVPCLAFGALPPLTEAQAQEAHANGSCGKLGPGTGLDKNGNGWIASMIPGPHEFRMVGGGYVGVLYNKRSRADFDAGRLYVISVWGPPGVLEWKIPGYEWGPVPKAFLYPPVTKQ